MTQWSGRGWTLAILALGLGVASDVPGAGLEDAQVGDSVQLFRPGVTIGKSGPDLVTLVRVDPYAEHARLWLDSGEGEARPLPRSPLRFFATSDRRLGERAYLVLEPDGKRFHSVVFAAGGGRRFEGEVDGQRLAVEASRPLDGADTSFQCAAAPRGYKVPEAAPPAATIATAKVAMYRAVVAVDTDNELMSLKFSNNTTLATNYLAELFVGMNVYYERDLDVRLAQGDTFLRVAADSYASTDPSVQLNEVSALWKDTPALAALSRAFVMFLSGKSPSPSSASGVAWLLESGNYCAAKGTVFGGDVFGHYSVTQVFRFAGATAANDVGIVGHELGHNFGVDHTHCTAMSGARPASSNTIDRCTTFETGSGCYNGPVSCPTDNSVSGRGSIMSYCHLSGSGFANCGPVLLEFHPVQQGVLDARIQTNVQQACLTVLPPACAGTCIFRHGFE